MERDAQHQNLIKLCAKAFAETELSLKTNYSFYFTEHLTEFSEDRQGNKNFDLLLVNEIDKSALFIECKTSIPTKAKTILSDIESKIRLIREKIEYLSELLEFAIDLDNIESVLCVYDKDSNKITDSLKAQFQKDDVKKAYDPSLIKLWIYRPHSQRIQLYPNHAHQNPLLNEMLLKGFGENELKCQFELPYCLSTHSYRLIRLAILGDCYAKNMQNDNVEDAKIIKISDIFDVLNKNIFLGMPTKRKGELISEKLECVIKFGEKYQIFERFNENYIKLNCQGKRFDIVLKNVHEKFQKKWIEERSEREGEKKAMEVFKKQNGVTQLSDFKK